MFAAKKRHKSVAGSPQEECELNLHEGAYNARFFFICSKIKELLWNETILFYEKL